MLKKKGEFNNFHPVANFIYFASVISFSMFIIHPVIQTLSLMCSFLYLFFLRGRKAFSFIILFMPIVIFTAIMNPVLNHNGSIVLAFFPNGSPLTLEAVLFGLNAGIMLSSVICWFSCFNEIISSEKISFLFAKISPLFSLLFSMVLRFSSRFAVQFKKVSRAQQGIGKGLLSGAIIDRIKHGINILSIMITWSLENAIDTADSVKSRGYGCAKRTSFSIYKFKKRDLSLVIFIMLLSALMTVLINSVSFSFYPYIEYPPLSPYSATAYLGYFLLCSLPMIIEIVEVLKWKK